MFVDTRNRIPWGSWRCQGRRFHENVEDDDEADSTRKLARIEGSYLMSE